MILAIESVSITKFSSVSFLINHLLVETCSAIISGNKRI